MRPESIPAGAGRQLFCASAREYGARVEPDFWKERWREGRLGWHSDAVQPFLLRHLDALDEPRRVLVPLAGKSLDIAHLATHGSAVVAVDLVEEAARAFFASQGVPATRTVDGQGARYDGGPIAYHVGDFFELGPAELGSFDGVYDRAALVALPPDMRARYVPHVRSMLEPGARLMLVTFEHDAGTGPPFSVPEAEVRALYAGMSVELLDEQDLSAEATSLRERGATKVVERVYLARLPREDEH